jgi:subtilase family serine protease
MSRLLARTLQLAALSVSFVAAISGVVAASQTPTAQASPLSSLRPVAQVDRVPAGAKLTSLTQLTGHLPRWANAANQVTAKSADLSAPMHLMVTLARDPAVEAALKQFLVDQQTPGSPFYHQWLTPQQVGNLYGPTQDDVAAVTSWLTAQGLTIGSVSPSRITIQVTGSAAAVANAFRTSFAYYNVAGQARLSNMTEPFLPAALQPVVLAIGGLAQIPLAPNVNRQLVHATVPVSATGHVRPQFTITDNGTAFHYLLPADFTTIYDIYAVYAGGDTGATIGGKAQHIAIMGESLVSPTDISEFAEIAGINSYNLNSIVVPTIDGGQNPGITNDGDQDEATLDVDRVIGTANGAIADLIVSSEASGGIAVALDYNVNTQLDPIQNVSFSACEIEVGSAAVNQADQFFEQAALEGIATFVSSGDSGAAGCEQSFINPQEDSADNPDATTPSINYLCASSYVTCVGGTEFNEGSGSYWNSTNLVNSNSSALSYIPEGGWNEPTTTNTSSGFEPASSGGGPSLYIAKPSWQVGMGVPADGQRDTPDVAFSAAGHDGYFACLDYIQNAGETCANGYFVVFSGTSAAAPSMASIAALVNTKLGTAQGSFNPLLYEVAASTPSAFHDVTVSTSGVSSCSTSTPSMCNNSVPSITGLTGGVAGYLVTTGYDKVTGLGSLDVNNFIKAAAAVSNPTQPIFTLSNPSVFSFTSGATSGNTATTTLTSFNGFAGAVTFTCSITDTSGTPGFPPGCTASSATLTAGGTGTSTISITSTTAQANATKFAGIGGWGLRGGIIVAVLLCVVPFRRRRVFRPVFGLLLAVGLSSMAGCSGSASPATSTQQKSSAGAYTVTVTGTGTNTGTGGSNTATASTSFTVTIN